jgi:hypothetical protein
MNDWREGFVAMCALLGEPLDDVMNALGEPNDLPLSSDLRDHDKSRRAVALSRALAAVVLAAENLQMDLPS